MVGFSLVIFAEIVGNDAKAECLKQISHSELSHLTSFFLVEQFDFLKVLPRLTLLNEADDLFLFGDGLSEYDLQSIDNFTL